MVKQSLKGVIKSVDDEADMIYDAEAETSRETQFALDAGATSLWPKGDAMIWRISSRASDHSDLRRGDRLGPHSIPQPRDFLGEFWSTSATTSSSRCCSSSTWASWSRSCRVKFEFPYVIYQGLTIYLLIAIGWHGGEELAELEARRSRSVVGFMVVGFVTNFVIGILAYLVLCAATTDAADRQGDGRRLLRLGLGRDVRDLPRRPGDGAHRSTTPTCR